MKTLYMAGPRSNPPVGEEILFKFLQIAPSAPTAEGIVSMLKPGLDNGDATEILRITIESIPFPTRSE